MAANTGEPQPERTGADLKTHPLVERLLQGGGEPRALVTLVGYVGPSKKEAHVRLYSGLDFQSYYEIPREQVVLAEPVDDGDENSPTQLLLEAEATVELVQTQTRTGPASYLVGAIAGAYLGEAAFYHPSPIVQPHTIWHCAITGATCICTLPILCYGNPGGVVGEEAALAAARIPGTNAWWRCPPVLGPPPDVAAAAANPNQTVFCGTQRCGPPGTLHCRWDVMPEAAAYPPNTHFCQTRHYACTAPLGGCYYTGPPRC
jgi:hypothetical protein